MPRPFRNVLEGIVSNGKTLRKTTGVANTDVTWVFEKEFREKIGSTKGEKESGKNCNLKNTIVAWGRARYIVGAPANLVKGRSPTTSGAQAVFFKQTA